MDRWFRCIGHRECAAKGWAKHFSIGEPYKLYRIDDPPVCLIMVDPNNPDDSWYVDSDQFEEIIEDEGEMVDLNMLVGFIGSELRDLNNTLNRMNVLIDAIVRLNQASDNIN